MAILTNISLTAATRATHYEGYLYRFVGANVLKVVHLTPKGCTELRELFVVSTDVLR
jgi:hypothetical protein